jgi:soluble lytic murein transglycosylase
VSSAIARHRTRSAHRRPSRAAVLRRRLALGAVGILLLGVLVVGVVIGSGRLGEAVREITLPLRHEDIIRQQSADKRLDPALVAAVIYEESKFRDQTSHAGARGLMQITPATAEFIAHQSGGTAFVQDDLATPQINISYGTYYLRYLLDRYDQNVTPAVAAYNAGHGNVDRWVRQAGGAGEFDVSDIEFPETRAYVKNVLDRRGDYRDHYASELGL